jgi:hypothetical protein
MSEGGGGGFILPDRLRQAVRLQIDRVNGKDLLTSGEIARSIAREKGEVIGCLKGRIVSRYVGFFRYCSMSGFFAPPFDTSQRGWRLRLPVAFDLFANLVRADETNLALLQFKELESLTTILDFVRIFGSSDQL